LRAARVFFSGGGERGVDFLELLAVVLGEANAERPTLNPESSLVLRFW
jgi:hypothetical protein